MQAFLLRPATVSAEAIDDLEKLLRKKMDLKTGYAEPFVLSRALVHEFLATDTSDHPMVTRATLRGVMERLNCGEKKDIVDELFHRYDRSGAGSVDPKQFGDSIFGLLPLAAANRESRDILIHVKETLLSRGEMGFRALSIALRNRDGNGKKMLDKKEFQRGLQSDGIDLSGEDLETLFFFLDKNRDGRISVTEFLVGLRPHISDARAALVKLAFLRLEKNSDGQVTFGTLSSLFCPEKHPLVLNGRKTASVIFQDFRASWLKDTDDVITVDEFLDYYVDMSATIDNDSYFEFLIRNVYKRGERSFGAQTGRRVLVTHLDGSSSIETLGYCDVTSERDMVTTLRKQGVSDILKIDYI